MNPKKPRLNDFRVVLYNFTYEPNIPRDSCFTDRNHISLNKMSLDLIDKGILLTSFLLGDGIV